MMKITLLFIIISANCVKMNCEEELNTTENVNGVSEKIELKSGDNEEIHSKTEKKENEKKASNSSEINEEIRISRSSSEYSTEKVSKSDDLSNLLSTEAPLTEKSSIDEMITEKQGSQVDEEVKQPTRRANSPDASKEVEVSSGNAEKHSKELSKTSMPASQTEDRNPEDLSEASSESKISDSEKASYNVNVTDRKAKNVDIEEKSDELLLNETRGTRRMFSATDNIVVNSKMRAGTTSTALEPEVKTALKQNFNTYNNYNEFAAANDIKLIDSSRTEPPTIIAKTNMPVVAKLAPEDVFDQQYKPKFYPRHELDINFPNVNSFQRPQGLPIYLKVKQGKNQYKEPPTSQSKSAYSSNFLNSNNPQQYFPPQKHLHPQGIFLNKQSKNLPVEARNQAAKLYHNQEPTSVRGFIENKQLTNFDQGTQNQIQQHNLNQGIKPNDQNFEKINLEVMNEDVKQNSKMSFNNFDLANQYPHYESKGMVHPKLNFENKQLGSLHFPPSPNSYLQQHIPQQVVLNDPRNKHDIIPANIKMLFQKLASASQFPRKLTTTLQSSNNLQSPYFINPGLRTDFSIYGPGYIPGF